SLQRRGQESVGVVSVNGRSEPFAVRAMGTLTESLGEQLARHPGVMAVGHTRYSTAGSSSIENAQPVLARSRGGYIALAHNGNLTNASELRQELENEGSIFASTNDSEVIVHRIAHSRAATPAERLAEALQGVEG